LHNGSKVLVVGTTADYIHWIRISRPDQALFITDPFERKNAREPIPGPGEEILCNLSDNEKACDVLQRHLGKTNIHLCGVISFDCESMALAADIARRFSLSYPSASAIENSRNKFLSKERWSAAHLQTPKYRLVRSAEEAESFYRKLAAPCVLKPVSGSGSELIFSCDSPEACTRNYSKIRDGLRRRSTHRLYGTFPETSAILAEEQITGDEYSCDVLVDHNRVDLIRLTRKIPARSTCFGTTLGYLLKASGFPEINEAELQQIIGKAATALEIRRGICMVDFMCDNGRIVLLEMAPRPGGDCLPFLLCRAWGLDILALALDFARNKPFPHAGRIEKSVFCGFRIFARQSGKLKRIDVTRLENDPRVLEIFLKRNAGDTVQMPPEDYDSRILGHVVMKPDPQTDPEKQCREMQAQIVVEME
jgi:biotin carboxylase